MTIRTLLHAVGITLALTGAATALGTANTVANATEPAGLLPSSPAPMSYAAPPTAGTAQVSGASLAAKAVSSAGYAPPVPDTVLHRTN